MFCTRMQGTGYHLDNVVLNSPKPDTTDCQDVSLKHQIGPSVGLESESLFSWFWEAEACVEKVVSITWEIHQE